jgi:hypothetical protein
MPMESMRWYVAMTYINPISGTAMAAAVQQEQLATDKTRQIRRQQNAQRNAAATDQFEHVVENAEEVAPIHDDASREGKPKYAPREKKPDGENPSEDKPRIDVVG